MYRIYTENDYINIVFFFIFFTLKDKDSNTDVYIVRV